jgi:hypothetical protein
MKCLLLASSMVVVAVQLLAAGQSPRPDSSAVRDPEIILGEIRLRVLTQQYEKLLTRQYEDRLEMQMLEKIPQPEDAKPSHTAKIEKLKAMMEIQDRWLLEARHHIQHTVEELNKREKDLHHPRVAEPQPESKPRPTTRSTDDRSTAPKTPPSQF